MLEAIQKLDDTIILYVYHHLHIPILDDFMIFITSLGNSGIIWIALTFLFLLFRNTRKLGILLSFALILELFLCDGVLKNLFTRPRPFTRFDDIKLLISPPHSFSFPSGHTASSFTAAFLIFYHWRQMGVFTLILATLIGLSRIYLFFHYPTDVLGGIVLGFLVAFCTIKAYKFYEIKLHTPG